MKRRTFLQSAAAVGLATSLPVNGLFAGHSIDNISFLTEKDIDRMLFPGPIDGLKLEISPPGFAWYPAKGAGGYLLSIKNDAGKTVYEKKLADPVHLPDVVLDPGKYSWDVHALDTQNKVAASRGKQSFAISESCEQLPWIPAGELLKRVPDQHSRVQFIRADLPNIRKSLTSYNKHIWQDLLVNANEALAVDPPVYPTYHKIDDPKARRLEYGKYFNYFRGKIDRALFNLSLAYLLSEERKYADAAKRIFLEVASWPTDDKDVSSVSAAWGDEVGLSFSRIAHKAYDWLYESFTPSEKDQILKMCEARAWQTYNRLKRKDYLTYPGESHDTRLIAYLSGMAIAMKGESDGAETWLDFSLKALTTTYPHWGSVNGGWAQGVAYGVWYNNFYIPAFDALDRSANYNLWKRPFYQKVRYFYLYCTSPLATMGAFGDAAERGGPASIPSAYANLLNYHAQRFKDPYLAWWVNQVLDGKEATGIESLIFDKKVAPKAPKGLPHSRLFEGVGWAGLHSNLAAPKEDTFMLFKSSPYGSVSHGHGDQNAFVIIKGGRALAIPSGYYGPSYGMPHHAEWTRSTKANNCVLVNGEGQSLRDPKAVGSITHFEDQKGYTYLIGDASPAYKGKLAIFKRHVLFLRPGIFLILDELSAPQPASFQWMLHSFYEMEMNENHVSVHNEGARLRVWMRSDQGLSLSKTDKFDTPFNAGIPEEYHKERPNQWHLTAGTKKRSEVARIVSALAVDAENDEMEIDVTEKDGWIGVVAKGSFGAAEGWLQMEQGSAAPKDFRRVATLADPLVCGRDITGKKVAF